MGKNRVTLETIADKAHVSKALVSRVLNNRTVRVSEQKRAQILRIANELDYIPNGQVFTNVISPSLNKVIALILPHLNYNFMSVIADTITKEAYENGYSVMIFDGKDDCALEMKYLNLCHSLKVSGIILDSFSSANNTKYIEKLSEWEIPFVFMDCYPNDPNVSVVSSQNRQGMFCLTENLIKRGHKNILSIIQDKSTLTNVSMQRINGYFEAMDKYDLSGYNEIIYPDRDYRMQPIYSLMNSAKEFTAFIIHTASDVKHFCEMLPTTKYAFREFYEIGVFDDFNIPFSQYVSRTNEDVYRKIVSVMSQRPQEIASRALNILLESIKKGKGFEPEQVFIECDLIYSASEKKTLEGE